MVRSQRNTQASSCVEYYYTTSAASLSILGFQIEQKRQPKWLSLLCWRYLFFRPVSRQVSSAQVSLTSVFGMGTGGPSLQSTPTYFFLKEKVSKKNFTPFFFQEEGLRFNYHTLKTEQSNRHTLRKRLHSISSSQPETSGQALGLLVPVSSIHYCTSTSGLSTI